MGKIGGSFALVAVLSLLSRFYHAQHPLFDDQHETRGVRAVLKDVLGVACALEAIVCEVHLGFAQIVTSVPGTLQVNTCCTSMCICPPSQASRLQKDVTSGNVNRTYGTPPINISLDVDDSFRIRSTPGEVGNLESIHQQIAWMNALIEPLVPTPVWTRLPHFWQSWLRNYVFAMAVYFGVGLLWSYYIYQCFGQNLFPKDNMPAWPAMLEQMHVSFWALPLYSLLPSITEELCARGHTLVYARVSDVGAGKLVAYLFLYMAFVEFGVYWMHRSLHDIPAGYRHLHHVHHKYNKEHSMSPFAGLAFHPLDGILQAFPYAVALFVVPMHFMLHEFLLFATALWTANIHDNIHANLLPIMGAGWHTIHHTSYKHNYGHYFVIMDWLFGTLISPEEYEQQMAERKASVAASVKAR